MMDDADDYGSRNSVLELVVLLQLAGQEVHLAGDTCSGGCEITAASKPTETPAITAIAGLGAC